MSTAPFDTRIIQQRIRERVPALRKVQGAADYATVKSIRDYPVPCLYVLLVVEHPAPTKTGIGLPDTQSRLAQQVDVTIGTVLAVRNYREQSGDQITGDLVEILGQVRNALLGWTPPVPGARALQLGQGELVDYDAATALWADYWHTQHIIKPEIT